MSAALGATSESWFAEGSTMFAAEDGLRLSATDVSNHLGCVHRTIVDRLAALGKLKKPFRNDAGINALRERGLAHEHAYLDALRARGSQVLDLSELDRK